MKIIFVILILITGSYVIASCESMSLTNVPTSISLNSNSFPSIQVMVLKGNGHCGDFFISLDNGRGGSSSSRQISSAFHSYPVQFFKDSARTQILKSDGEASSGDVIAGSFDNGESSFSSEFYAYLNLGNNSYLRSGVYSENFTLKLFEGTPDTKILRDTKMINLSFIQNKIADLSLVNSGEPFNLASTSQSVDFGDLVPGAHKGFDLVLMYNAGYTVSFSSINAGKLKHSNRQKYVAYVLTLDGVPVALSSMATVVKSAAGISLAAGTRLPVNVKIGNTADAVPGYYSDIITVNVASAE